MIDYSALNKAYENNGVYSLQLEIGDICNQECIYCYMNALPDEVNSLSDSKISEILEDSKRLGITAIEWLGGEPLLRKSVFEHMAQAADLGFKNNMWTGGLPLKDDYLLRETARYCQNGAISFHLSTLDPDRYKLLHPNRPIDDLSIIIEGIKKLLDIGYPAKQLLNSVTFTGLQTSEDMIRTIDYFEHEHGIMTSLNVFHTYLRPDTTNISLERFIPSRSEVAKVYSRYNKQLGVKQSPMNCVNKQYCSTTIAVLCNGDVTSCATIREPDAPNVNDDSNLYDIFQTHRDHLIFKRFKAIENLPEQCQKCKISDSCWGCRSRAYAAGQGLYGIDPRCFRKRSG